MSEMVQEKQFVAKSGFENLIFADKEKVAQKINQNFG